MPVLQPHYTFLCYRHVTPDFLREKGIRVLLLDIDNTLAPYEQPEPDDRLRDWLDSLHTAGIQTAFLSNNHGERVELFSKTLDVPVQYDAHKPLPFKAKKMLKTLGADRSHAALMGDQIFTDVLCARWAGIRALLVPPIKDKTDRFTRFKRRMEKGVLKRYYKKNSDAPDVRLGSPLAEEYKTV